MFGFGTKRKELQRLRHRILSLEELASGSTNPTNGSHDNASPALPIAYYSDRDTLNQIASGKGINPASVRFEVGQGVSNSSAQSAELNAQAFGLGAGFSQTTERAVTKDQRIIFEREPSIIDVVNLVLSALTADDQLRRDLLSPPPAAKEEMRLLRALRPFPARWNIELVSGDRPPDQAAPTSDQEAKEQTTDRVDIAVEMLGAFAYITAQQEKAKEYEALKKNGELTLVETTWTVEDDPERGLCLHPIPLISADWLPSNTPDLITPIHVSVDQSALTDQGRARLVSGSRVWASVFGTVFCEARQKNKHVTARIAPITIIGDLAGA